ncbi:MAG: amidohydrolase family protein [Ardenticatenaceae bacterium]|nr:amidohydrolase family protein [Ardenticatenaceae bacterium]
MDRFDVLVKDATIVDGSGGPAYRGSLGVRGERVTAIGAVSGIAGTVIDGAELVVSPGFIDPHSHGDVSILKYPLAESKIMQGITTFVGGNCGMSLAPVRGRAAHEYVTRWFDVDITWETFGGFLDTVQATGTSVNVVPLVGHNAIRTTVLGTDFKRRAIDSEITRMQAHVHEAMQSGAFGFTTGLDASPGEYADLTEIVPLAEVAGQADGLYATHVRHNQTQWPADSQEEYAYGLFHGPIEDVWVGRYRGYQEAIEVGRRARLPVQISHLAYAYVIPQPHPDFLAAAVARATVAEFVDRPRREGLRVTFDTIFSPSGIASPAPLVTAFKQALAHYGKAVLVEKLRSPEFRQELKDAYDSGKLKLGMLHPKADPFWADCFELLVFRNQARQGKTVAVLLAEIGGHPVDLLADLILEDPDAVWAQTRDKKRTPPGLAAFLEHPLCMPCTDAFIHPAAPPAGDPTPPPIAYGNYAAYLDTYVKQQAVLSLEEAIHRATGLVAETFGLKDRGILQPGAYADIVILDLETIGMRGDALHPDQPPEGIDTVLVNGQVVYRNKAHTGAQPGKVLRKQ